MPLSLLLANFHSTATPREALAALVPPTHIYLLEMKNISYDPGHNSFWGLLTTTVNFGGREHYAITSMFALSDKEDGKDLFSQDVFLHKLQIRFTSTMEYHIFS